MTNKVIRNTNEKLSNWYKNAKLDYGVEGSAEATIEGNIITINFTEGGVAKVWNMAYYPEYVEDNGLNYFFNVWAEQAR